MATDEMIKTLERVKDSSDEWAYDPNMRVWTLQVNQLTLTVEPSPLGAATGMGWEFYVKHERYGLVTERTPVANVRAGRLQAIASAMNWVRQPATQD